MRTATSLALWALLGLPGCVNFIDTTAPTPGDDDATGGYGADETWSWCRDEVVGWLEFGSTSGELAAGDVTVGPQGTGFFRDAYFMDAGPSGRIRVTMSSAAFDTFLYVFDATDCTQMAFNDDGGGSTNSLVTLTAAPGRDLVIFATSYRSSAVGGYLLDVEGLW
jgi:hypothetical protein